MYNFFGKSKSKSKKASVPAGLPAPDVAGTAFGRYLRYGHRAAFGRQYFGARRIALFGKKRGSKKATKVSKLAAPEEEMASAFGMYKLPKLFFGRRRYRRKGVRKGRKGGRKVAKPSKALVRMCRKYRIKVTRKVGKRKVYKKVSVLKKQLKRKMRLHRKKSKKSKKTVRRTRRRSTRRNRFSLFGM
jgi:hypothetical protein